jgi:tRNA A37 threonylcarbamoyladenosine dehydratase
MDVNPFESRFGGVIRLYGVAGATRLMSARVTVIGLGGVGSWAAEAIARTGIQHVRLIDMDDVCVTNINRQLVALESTVGKQKADVLAERLRSINSDAEIIATNEFFLPSTAESLLTPTPDLVIDAIDDTANKVALLATCHERRIPTVTCGGAGGRRDAGRVRHADLNRTTGDGLLRETRRRLRREYDFPETGDWGIPCAFSDEPIVFPIPDIDSDPDSRKSLRIDCSQGLGAATHVTATMGMRLAQLAIEQLLRGN